MKNTVKTDFRQFLVYAGQHPWEDAGWQIGFDFGKVQVSIACTPETRGVELMAWGLFLKPLEYVTPAMALEFLERMVRDE